MIVFSLDLITASQIFRTLTTRGRPSAIRATCSSAAGSRQVCSRAGEAEGRRPRNRRRTTFWQRDWPPAREVADREESPAAEWYRRRDRIREIPFTCTSEAVPPSRAPTATLRERLHPVRSAPVMRI